MTDGNFEPIAAWWDEQVGEHGDFWHRHYVLPALVEVLGDVAEQHVLDLASGNGASSRFVAQRGARVTGVEVSPTLVQRARDYEQDQPLGIDYLVADAATIPLPDARFDAVSCNMALMDIADAAGAIREAARLLRPGGRFVASLFHPCFQVLDGSSWLVETAEFETQIARKVWRYRDEMSALGVAKANQPTPHTYYHRPLNWYARQLSSARLAIDALHEPLPDATFAAKQPESYARVVTIPAILVIGARKVD